MEKHSKEKKTPRRHSFVEKAPVPAAIILAVSGWVISIIIAGLINNFIMLDAGCFWEPS